MIDERKPVPPKTLVSDHVMFRRLARKLLKEDGVILKRCHETTGELTTLGEYYTINRYSNDVESRHINLRDWATELDLLDDAEEWIDQ